MIHKVSDRIIIVDDMPDIAQIIAERLRNAGFENITVYTNPLEALKAIHGNTRPAIVITDFNMPDLNGVELLAEIDLHHPEIDGVVVTGNISAAMESPHRYMVIDKSTNFYRELTAHVLGIIRSHLLPLLSACPTGNEKVGCPLKDIRKLSISEKMKWLDALRPADIHPLIQHHLSCMRAVAF